MEMDQSTLNTRILQHDRQVPRYTSYPTAPHFSEQVGEKQYHHWLEALPGDTSLSLYVHIPFCRELCWYCGCHTKATRRYEPVSQYLGYLEQEIALLSERLHDTQNVTHLHFGGGSPTMLQGDDFRRLMQCLRDHFPFDERAEIALEADPRGLTEARIAAYAASGVNRVSLGVQEFNSTVQKAINREQPFRMVYESVSLLREYEIEQLNIDLMYGLPFQTKAMLRQSAEYALWFQPDRVALFGYAHVPWMKKHMRLIPEASLPKAAERLEMAQAAQDILLERGYVQIGLDHFVKPEDSMAVAWRNKTLARNFQGYTTDVAPVLLGLGVSSIGQLPSGYIQNTSQVKEYCEMLDEGRLPVIKGVMTTAEDRLRREIIQSLMCYMEVDVPAVCRAHHADAERFAHVYSALKPLAQDGLVSVESGKITVHPEARPVVRVVCAAFDAHMQSAPQQARHSQAV